MKRSTQIQTLRSVADQIQSYVESNLFDDVGLMISAVDCRTDRPFDRALLTPNKVPRRAAFDPWSWLSYEDSIMTMGHYIDGLVMKYELTGDSTLLERAMKVWSVCWDVFHQSQVYGGRGCFLRPYGGFDVMERFGEPLGTDQAAPLFAGVFRLSQHASASDRRKMIDMLVSTLKWYADLSYAYRYYKCMQHEWKPPGHHHATSFYLPAIALAARETGEKRWRDDLDFYLRRQLTDAAILESDAGVAWNFKQSGLLEMRALLGNQFTHHFSTEILNQMYVDVQRWLSRFDEPGLLHRDHPQSKQPGFKPYLRADFHPARGAGFAHQFTVHGARQRPRHEVTLLAALAALGVPGAAEKALDVFLVRQKVPIDFTHYLAQDHDLLPDESHLYARIVGALMVDWWRNAWVLLHALHAQPSEE